MHFRIGMTGLFRFVPARIFTLFVSEMVLLAACYVAAAFADPDVGDVGLFLAYDSGVIRIAIAVAFVIVGLFLRNLYAEIRIRNRLFLFQNLCLIFGMAFIGQGALGYLDPLQTIPRKMMLGGSVLAVAVLFGWRLLFDRAARGAVAAGRILFIGMSPEVMKIASHFDAHPELGMRVIGYLESRSPTITGKIPRLGTMNDLDEVLDRTVPDSVVIGNRGDIQPWWADAFLALRFGGIRVQEVGTLYERIFVRKCVTEIWPANAVFGDTCEPRISAFWLISIYSWIIAAAAVAITLPFTLTIAVLIRIGSRGPVLTRETRIGRNDVPFEAFRFRYTGGRGEVTTVGSFLRRHGLVWLPQLLNVLKGQMAIVGPRPERPLFAQRMSELIPIYRQRHRVKPGLTGWARIHRKPDDEQDSLRDLEYDLYYLKNLSPLMDIFILLLSLRAADWADDSAS
jgi:lipopolysaccharide/colanic/teichoic acid biosynthesis glycosyltransferase